MPEPEEKRIALRVDPETWEAWNDKRHAEKTSFQQLGLRLFAEWAGSPDSAKKPKEIVPNKPKSSTALHKSSEIAKGRIDKVLLKAKQLAGLTEELRVAATGLMEAAREIGADESEGDYISPEEAARERRAIEKRVAADLEPRKKADPKPRKGAA